MDVPLDPEIERVVLAKVGRGEYPSVAVLVEEALYLLVERDWSLSQLELQERVPSAFESIPAITAGATRTPGTRRIDPRTCPGSSENTVPCRYSSIRCAKAVLPARRKTKSKAAIRSLFMDARSPLRNRWLDRDRSCARGWLAHRFAEHTR